jgi:hypothetical protein
VSTDFKNTNDIVFAVAEMAKKLGNLNLPDLRRRADYVDEDPKYKNRGELIEKILCEEFLTEHPKDIEES